MEMDQNKWEWEKKQTLNSFAIKSDYHSPID